MLLEGKVVLVTGASKGIGAATSRVLASQGASVVVNYQSGKDRAEAVVAQIRQKGGKAVALGGDVRDEAEVSKMIEQTIEAFGRIDGVVNNAIAGTQCAKLDDSDWDTYQNMLDFGCKAVVNTTRYVRPVFAAQGGGSIVNIVTELWNMAPSGWSMYAAGKGAMVGLSRSLALELGPENIRVNMVAPGWMVTESVDTSGEGSKGYTPTVPLGRHGSADEIGNVVAFYMSDLATFLTGTYLPVCGGRVTQMGS